MTFSGSIKVPHPLIRPLCVKRRARAPGHAASLRVSGVARMALLYPVSSGSSSCVEVPSVVVVVVTMLLSRFMALDDVSMDGLVMTMRSMVASSARGMRLHGYAW